MVYISVEHLWTSVLRPHQGISWRQPHETKMQHTPGCDCWFAVPSVHRMKYKGVLLLKEEKQQESKEELNYKLKTVGFTANRGFLEIRQARSFELDSSNQTFFFICRYNTFQCICAGGVDSRVTQQISLQLTQTLALVRLFSLRGAKRLQSRSSDFISNSCSLLMLTFSICMLDVWVWSFFYDV